MCKDGLSVSQLDGARMSWMALFGRLYRYGAACPSGCPARWVAIPQSAENIWQARLVPPITSTARSPAARPQLGQGIVKPGLIAHLEPHRDLNGTRAGERAQVGRVSDERGCVVRESAFRVRKCSNSNEQ
jgi:hypothetical protein